MMRRAVLQLLGLAPFAGRGTGGTPDRPAGYVPPALPGQAAGSQSGLVRARQVIVSGPNEGVFSYSPNAGAGNLVATAGIASAGTDVYGNQYLAGNSVYGSGVAVSEQAGQIGFYTGSLAGGWAFTFGMIYDAINSRLAINGPTFVNGSLTAGGSVTINGAGLGLSLPNATQISAPACTAINLDVATMDIANGNINLNMAKPPNYAAVVAGTATQAQYNACLGGLVNSMHTRQLLAP